MHSTSVINPSQLFLSELLNFFHDLMFPKYSAIILKFHFL